EAKVVYPPVDVDRFSKREDKDDYFLFLSRLVPYKKGDLVVEAFTRLKLPLKVVGEGPQFEECRRLAGANVEMLGYQSDEVVTEMLSRARALVFAADEDFGIVPVEAQACGTPVIAYGHGGATETVIPANGSNWDRATGVYFGRQDLESLCAAIVQFVRWEDRFDASVI
ncbi:MAG: glycosyltransferase, partial [Syntrophomonadaceae bacterium]|nr:glycosyltransferase [Syntrophomonadaceae bacterium]